jgi:hypothetical protein
MPLQMVFKNMHKSLLCLMLAALPLLVRSAWADEPTIEQKFGDRIRWFKANATNIRSDIDELTTSAQTAAAFTKNDVAMMKKYMEDDAKLWDSAAARLSTGDEKGADAIAHQGETMEVDRRIFFDRIQTRIHAAQLSPTEETYDDLLRDKPATALPAVGRLVEARKKAADAYQALADVLAPGFDPAVRSDFNDKAYAAEIEADVAQLQFFWAIDDGYWRPDPTVASPELQALDERKAALRQQRIDDYRQQKLLQRKIEKEDEEYRKMGDANRQLYDKALRAREKQP